MFSNSKLYKEDIKYIAAFKIDWDAIRDRCILITGSTGLIGTVLVDTLMYKNSEHGLGIRILAMTRDRKKALKRFNEYANHPLFTIIEGDITSQIITEEKIDYIVNLASHTHPLLYASEPINTIEAIISGTRNVLELAASNNSKRVINVSSVEVYGENRGDVERFTEDYCGYIDCNTLRAGYPEGKRLSEAMCQAYISERSIDVISARLGRVYGATTLDSDTKATSQFIRNAVDGADIVLKSEGKQEFSYVYVADAITAIITLLIDGKNGEAYNVSNDEIKTFRETAAILANINNKKVTFELPNMTESRGFSVVQKALMDSSKLKGLGWSAKYQLVDGLTRTVNILKSKKNEEAA